MPVGFLSEMSAMPIHGGGVTLSRILEDQIEQFDWIAKTIHYPQEPFPSYPTRQQCIVKKVWPIQRVLSPIIGCRTSYSIAKHSKIRYHFAQRVKKDLLRRIPDLLKSRMLVCPQAEISLIVIHELLKIAPVKYATWMMDDHLVRWTDGAWTYPGKFKSIMDEHLNKAQKVYVISPAMREFYLEQFGVESDVLCGPAALTCSPSVEPSFKKTIRLAYFGSLGRWQNDAIELLSPLLERGDMALDVFSHNPDALPEKLRSAGGNVQPGIPSTEILSTASNYDAMVLPISFKEELRNMSFFNVATKFSECLASSIPTLIIGPPDACMIKIARKANAGIIVDTPSSEAIEEALPLLRDDLQRAQILRAEQDLLAKEFSPEVMHSRWLPASEFLFQSS